MSVQALTQELEAASSGHIHLYRSNEDLGSDVISGSFISENSTNILANKGLKRELARQINEFRKTVVLVALP